MSSKDVTSKRNWVNGYLDWLNRYLSAPVGLCCAIAAMMPLISFAYAGDELFVDEQRLLAADGTTGDALGFSVAIAGNIALIGAETALVGPARPGAALVFEYDLPSGIWNELVTLSADDALGFGASVAISGNTAVIGAPRTSVAMNARQGAAYVFVRNPITGVWSQKDKLVAVDGAANDEFGKFVSIDGDVIAVSTDLVTVNNQVLRGAAYIYRRFVPTGAWVQEAKLTAPDGVANDFFGSSISVSGGIVAVGAFRADVFFQDQGAVYVFQLDPASGLWFWQAKLIAADASTSDSLGFGFPGVVIAGTRILARSQDHQQSRGGAVYVFERETISPVEVVWNPAGKLVTQDGDIVDKFGHSVALSGDTALVGSPGSNSADNLDQGAAYFFTRESPGIWVQRQKLVASDGMAFDNFGHSVALSQLVALIGTPFVDPDGNTTQGAAYVYRCGDILHADDFEGAAGCEL